ATVDGVTRQPDVADFLAALADPKSAPPGLLTQLSAFGAGKKDSYSDLGISERCLMPSLVPMVPGLGDNYVQIVQSRESVALRTDEFIRIVSLDGKAQPAAKLRSSNGISRGRWEGDTLVIETRNFTGRSQAFGTRAREKVVIERITRTAKNGLE